MDEKKLATKFSPVIRRALVGDVKADRVRVFGVESGEPDVELVSMPVSGSDVADDVAMMVAASAIDECEANGADRVRLVCEHDGESLCELVVRVKARKASADVIGDALMPRGQTREEAMLRQSMRQAENYARVATGLIDKWSQRLEARETVLERRENNVSSIIESLSRGHVDMQDRHLVFLKQHAESIAQDNASKVALIEADAKSEAVKEVVALAKTVTPKIMARIMGDDKLTPVIDILARATPEQVDLLVATGFIKESEKELVLETAAKAKRAVAKASATGNTEKAHIAGNSNGAAKAGKVS